MATCSIYEATLGDSGLSTAEVTTLDVRRILAEGGATLVDTRKPAEFAAGHIPGAHNIPSYPDPTPEEAVAPVVRLVDGNRDAPLVLYCNGPFCKGTRRLSEQLVAADFTDVRRYQLGIPIWRALGGPTEATLDGVVRLYGVDRTAVWFDARKPAAFAVGTLAGAHNVPSERLADGVPEDAPLPKDDFNTRIVLFGQDGEEARALADALSRTPFHNVIYFGGTYSELAAATAHRPG